MPRGKELYNVNCAYIDSKGVQCTRGYRPNTKCVVFIVQKILQFHISHALNVDCHHEELIYVSDEVVDGMNINQNTINRHEKKIS